MTERCCNLYGYILTDRQSKQLQFSTFVLFSPMLQDTLVNFQVGFKCLFSKLFANELAPLDKGLL